MKTALKATAGVAGIATAAFLLFSNHFLYAWGWL